MLLSFDIGTRHLAYCALSLKHEGNTLITAPNLKHWNIVDLLSVEGTPYTESATYVCIKKWTVKKLRQWLDEHALSSHGKRDELQARITKHLLDMGVLKVTPNNPCFLATQLYAYLDKHPWMLDCDQVVLENQPCLTNPVMKSVQLMLFSYFMYRGVWCEFSRRREIGHTILNASAKLPKVSLVSASNKLKAEMTELVDSSQCVVNDTSKGKKNAYKIRKQNAIALTSTLLDKWCAQDPDTFLKWRTHFQNSNKKEQDDLSDCLLQGLYVLRKEYDAKRTKAIKLSIRMAKHASKAAKKAIIQAEKVLNKQIRKTS